MSNDNIIHVDFGGRGRAGRRVEPDPSMHVDGAEARTRDPLSDAYTIVDVAQLFGLSVGRLRYWERSGFVQRSGRRGRARFYTFQDLISIRTAKGLLDAGASLRAVRRGVGALRESLPRVAQPLNSLRVIADGQTVLVRDAGGAYDPTTGQQQLDFEVSQLRDDVVRVLRRAERPNDYRMAYEAFLEGCRFDDNESTFDRAEAAYRRAIELDPTLANALTNLANLLQRMHGPEADVEAEELYHRALRVDPEQPEAFHNLGMMLYARGDLEGALHSFRRAVASDPSFADAQFNIGATLTELGRPEQAIPHFRTYVELDPDSTWAEIARRHLDAP